MKPIVRASVIASSLIAAFVATPVIAQNQMPKGKITVEYEPSLFFSINSAVKQQHVLEELAEFLSALRLPADLKITTADCGVLRAPYQAGRPIKICYELISQIEEAAKAIYPQDKASQDLVLVGAFMQAVLHETAHAIFNILEVPIWGREDDAADRLAALIMVALGEDIEKVTVYSTITLFKWSANSAKTWTGSSFSDTASPDAQRYFNYLCIAAAADYPSFGGAIENGTIPPDRARSCAHEYEQVRSAFYQRIMPYVDPDALVKVRATNWLKWTPGK